MPDDIKEGIFHCVLGFAVIFTFMLLVFVGFSTGVIQFIFKWGLILTFAGWVLVTLIKFFIGCGEATLNLYKEFHEIDVDNDHPLCYKDPYQTHIEIEEELERIRKEHRL